jgi:hypothetical protein
MSGDFKWRHLWRDYPVGGAVVLQYGVSYRNLEEMMEERGVDLDHTTLYRWVQCYAPEIEKRLRWLGAAQQVAGMSTRPISKCVADGFISTGLWMSKGKQSISIFPRHGIQKQRAGFSARR